MIKDRMIVEIIRILPKEQNESLDEEAENITDCLLDAIGFPPGIVFEVRVLLKERIV
jgi:hypothetical protein